jgi:penicillin-binding protein 1A
MSRRERKRQRRAHRGHPVRRVVLMTLLIGACALIVGALLAVGWVVSVADSAPNLSQLKPKNPHPPSVVYASDGELLGYIHSDTIYAPVADGEIPATLKQATVAIEDRRFYHHGALDYQGILRAGIKDIFGSGGSLQGASTLTMQLIDNRYLDGTKYAAHHDLKYKIIQAKLAEQLVKKHPGRPGKNWILDNYLNDVPYGTVGGQTAIGVGAGAQMFFDKPVSQLDLAQQALLAGLPQSPSQYNPFLYRAKARTRRTQVLQAMVSARYITQEQASAAEREPLNVHVNVAYRMKRQPYVFDYVQQQLIQKFGLKTAENGGLKVYTTLDMKRQQEAQAAIYSHEGGPVLDDQPAAALTSVDPTNGHILAMASSSTYDQTKFNYAANAHRQPGSSFKVFALMTLIHDYDGDPSQTFYTSQFLPAGWEPAAPDWSVHTAEQTYQGTIDVMKATTISDNTVFAQLAADLGWDKLDETAHAMGITSPLDGYPSEVIGGLRVGVTTEEMADAYATLANGGDHIPPTIISKVVFPDGSSLNLGDPPRKGVFSSGESYAATQVLQTVIQSGTGTAADYGCPAAGKTGTANNMDNAWFVGYTPQLSTAVWVGYPQGNIPMADGFGGALAAPIWHDYMTQASNGFCGDFPQPSSYWHGTAYFGAHSATGAPSTANTGNTGSGSGSTTGSTTPYTNPTLYAHPPQPATHTTTTGGGAPAPAPPAAGHGHGHAGGGNGYAGGGNGNGAGKKTH